MCLCDLAPKSLLTLAPGDVLKLFEAGGGGFGDPHERDADKVRQDVADGLVTADAALRDYGVTLDRTFAGAPAAHSN